MAFDVDAYARSFSLVGTPPLDVPALPGAILPLRLETDEIVGSLDTVEAVLGQVDLNLLLRHLELTSLADDTPVGPWPAPAAALLAGAPGADSVEAWAGKISGLVPAGTRAIHEELRIDVRWYFRNTNGEELEEGTDYVVKASTPPLGIDVVFAPDLVWWEVSPSESLKTAAGATNQITRTVQAEVRVRAVTAGADSGWIPVPAEPVPVVLLPLPVLRLALCFRSDDFGSTPILCMIPSNFLKGSLGGVLDILGAIEDAVQALKTFSRFAPLGEVVSLALSKLPGSPVTVETHESIKDMNDVILKKGTIWDDDWEDRISSLAVMAIGDWYLKVYENDDFGGADLKLRPGAIAGNAAVLVRNLHANYPAAEPSGAMSQDGYPSGGWGNKISSFKWDH